MNTIGTETINESRGMGYSRPQAIRSSIEPKAWLGCLLYDTGCAIDKSGDHLHNLCGCKD
jgi:hypothetical protein